MEKLFISYELALKAKEHGFNEPCFGVYYANTRDFPIKLEIGSNKEQNSKFINAKAERLCVAPIHQQITDWLRETYNIHVLALPTDFINDPAKTYYSAKWFNKYWYELEDFESYYEALDRAIEEAFKIIEENGK